MYFEHLLFQFMSVVSLIPWDLCAIEEPYLIFLVDPLQVLLGLWVPSEPSPGWTWQARYLHKLNAPAPDY